MNSMPNVEIFIVTHAKDFPWLKYCLRSISKFATGFRAVRILVPHADLTALGKLIDDEQEPSIPIIAMSAEEWPGLGMLWHEAQIMHTDRYCKEADYVAHLDPDCVFTAPVTPLSYFRFDRPILRYENFHFIGLRHPGVLKWQECTNACLPFPVHYETMRCHPEVYHLDLYRAARELIERKTGKITDEYLKTCRNEFPQTFCEFVTLGNVAMHLFPHLYHLAEQFSDHTTPPNFLQQFWSHGAIDQPQDIWVRGEQLKVVPLKMLTDLGLA